jgi:hypothetical protein
LPYRRWCFLTSYHACVSTSSISPLRTEFN